MKKILTVIFLFISSLGFTQKRGINFDPSSQAIGDKPYEMATRKENKVPVVDFENCEKWIIETENAETDLYLSSEQRIFGQTSGKLVYKTTQKKASVRLIYEEPIEIKEPWDCIDFWTYGDHWLWGEPHFSSAFKHYALIEDADGEIHELDFSQSGYRGLIHKYWFLNHIKLNENIEKPAKFIGIKLQGDNTVPGNEHTIFFGPIYFYQELLKELTFKNFPDTLPFPLRKETILPTNRNSDFINVIQKVDNFHQLSYLGKDMELEYIIDLSSGVLNGIKVKANNSVYELCKDAEFVFSSDQKAEWNVKNETLQKDTLFVEFIASTKNQKYNFLCWYTINQKSLIIGIHEESDVGHVKEITLGETGEFRESKLITIPFLPYNYGRHPKLLFGDDLFFFKQFDWYYSDASNFSTKNSLSDGWANYNNGVEYIPKTDGKLNPIREKLFINVSEDVIEVLPTIDNPSSPMRSYQANRLWMIDGSPDYEENKKNVRKYRSLGLENVTIRYHEGFWRDGGESYTFRTKTAPGRGGNKAVREFIRDIKDLDWRVGLYSNYTDFAPVNENWNPDWVLQEPDGNWQVSWSRCYAPKPMIALEQQSIYAPLINKSLGPNHSYCDVHTAVSPMSRVDYDYRVPGAATFRRTFECFGLLLLNEKIAYRGPVFSEGANHWWYAGLTDGNYANYSPLISTIPIMPEFQLYKIHPLQMDAGNLPAKGTEYLAYTLAYGHIGILQGEISEMIKRYAVLQTLQNHYSMIPVENISYYDKENKEYNSSMAIRKELNKNAKLKIEYINGFTIYINFSQDNWRINAMNKYFTLPHHGFLAFTKDEKTYALSGKCDDFSSNEKDYRIDLVVSSDQYYFDTYGASIKLRDFEAQGKIFFKKEKFGWEIIPAEDFKKFSFNKDLVDLKNTNIIIEGVDEGDLLIEDANIKCTDTLVNMAHNNKSILKYRVVPTIKMN
jgi:hypothetical protein